MEVTKKTVVTALLILTMAINLARIISIIEDKTKTTQPAVQEEVEDIEDEKFTVNYSQFIREYDVTIVNVTDNVTGDTFYITIDTAKGK
jgi:hypothetical protein